jgi:hypothetical protein
LAPDGAVWFPDVTTASVTRLQNGTFTHHDVGSQGATPRPLHLLGLVYPAIDKEVGGALGDYLAVRATAAD